MHAGGFPPLTELERYPRAPPSPTTQPHVPSPPASRSYLGCRAKEDKRQHAQVEAVHVLRKARARHGLCGRGGSARVVRWGQSVRGRGSSRSGRRTGWRPWGSWFFVAAAQGHSRPGHNVLHRRWRWRLHLLWRLSREDHRGRPQLLPSSEFEGEEKGLHQSGGRGRVKKGRAGRLEGEDEG